MTRTHAILDRESRHDKAEKILALIQTEDAHHFQRVLEVGCGSGFIAAFFSRINGVSVHAVDVVDERQIREGFEFKTVDSTDLPYPDASFDLIISNHVVEHVGPEAEQNAHLQEIFRCLRPGGILYFAVPNRWRLIEPHYRLPLLSWLPQQWGHRYMRMLNKGTRYDCRPLSTDDARRLLERANFKVRDVTLDAIPLVSRIEGGMPNKLVAMLPRFMWRLAMPIMPTLIFICRKPAH